MGGHVILCLECVELRKGAMEGNFSSCSRFRAVYGAQLLLGCRRASFHRLNSETGYSNLRSGMVKEN